MKIFTTYHNYPCASSLFPSKGEREPVVACLPDTALLKDNKPFFIPDWAEPCMAYASLVVHVSRLGRCISPRFAYRYYDAVTVGLSFVATPLLETAVASASPWSAAVGFDGAAVIGSFLPLDEQTRLDSATFRVTCDGESIMTSCRQKTPRWTVDDIIAHVSTWSMLRRGDLIYLGYPAQPLKLTPETHLNAYLNETLVFSMNIK